ncbi:MAG TPA: 8-oxo-dGTP diphosphatase MutT, partial [Oceanospirillales bacterium]|nr:8-oxo-dGTP diphosphatase MutT [Oceanospirillales bacterium]
SDVNDALLAHGAEGQEVRWVNYTRLDEFEFPEANKAIILALTERLS